MSRYVDKKHGMVIGSDNIFFFRDEADVFHSDFRAICWPQGYRFEEYNYVNGALQTPAEQLLFIKFQVEEMEYFEFKGKNHECPRIRTHFKPTPFIVSWLDKNTPGWGFPAGERANVAFFFKKRSHAVALCKEVERLLKGMTIGRD